MCVCLPFLLCVCGPVLGPSGGLLTLKGLTSDDDVLLIRDKPPFQVRVPRPKKPFLGAHFGLFWPFFGPFTVLFRFGQFIEYYHLMIYLNSFSRYRKKLSDSRSLRDLRADSSFLSRSGSRRVRLAREWRLVDHYHMMIYLTFFCGPWWSSSL